MQLFLIHLLYDNFFVVTETKCWFTLPCIISYCFVFFYLLHVYRYVDTLKDCDDIDIQLQKHFVIQQLLAITVYMDLTDTVSRWVLGYCLFVA
jgi:hypothetical protein